MILLDTHVLVWLVAEPRRLSAGASRAIRAARRAGGLGVASITLWELAVLFARGRLRAHGTVQAAIEAMVDHAGITVKPLTPLVAVLATEFPDDFPGDPADRLIAATARADGLALVTRDDRIRASPLLRTIW